MNTISSYPVGRMWTHKEYERYLLEIEAPLYPIEEYKGNKVKILHRCVNGHDTLITPSDLKHKKSECSQCSGAKHSLESFNNVLKAQGSEFICVEYNTGKKPCAFLCNTCKEIWRTRSDNLSSAKSGCPNCSIRGFKNNIPGFIYYIKITNRDKETYYKIGITNKSIVDRFRTDKDKTIEILLTKYFIKGIEARKLESFILKRFAKYRISINNFLNGGGNTELFTRDIFDFHKGALK